MTPVPGGVGPMTIAMLLRSTVRAAGATGEDCLPIPNRDAMVPRASSRSAARCPGRRLFARRKIVGSGHREVVLEREGLRVHRARGWRRRLRPLLRDHMEGYQSLTEGQRVEFEVVQGDKGLQAANVTADLDLPSVAESPRGPGRGPLRFWKDSTRYGDHERTRSARRAARAPRAQRGGARARWASSSTRSSRRSGRCPSSTCPTSRRPRTRSTSSTSGAEDEPRVAPLEEAFANAPEREAAFPGAAEHRMTRDRHTSGTDTCALLCDAVQGGRAPPGGRWSGAASCGSTRCA